MLLTAAKIAAEMKERDGFNRPITPEHRQVLTDFIDSKFSKYINTELGTEKDPVRQAILSGEAFPSSRLDMPLYDQAEAYRKALARETEDPDFVRISKDTADLMYDVGTNIKPSMLVTLDNLTDASQNILINRPQAVRELIRDISKGKRTEDPSLPADLNQLARTYADSIAKNAKLMTEEGNQNALQTLRADDNINFRLLSGQQFQGLNQTLQKAVNRDLVFDMSDPAYLGEFNPDRMIETLAAVPPDKLKNMSFTQAYQEGTRLLSSMRSYDKGVADVKAGKAVPKEFLFTYTEPVLDTPKGKWVKFTDPRVNEVEGKLMGHSVAGYNETKPYSLSGAGSTGREAFLSGDAEILSLRNEKGMPMVTLEYGKEYNSKDPKYVWQINGKFNSAPVEYLVDVLELMRKNNLQFSPNRKGASNINVHKNNRKGESLYYTDPETGKDVVAYDVVDWPALYKSYKENTGPFEVVKISKPVETKNQIDRTVFYTTPERLNLLNSEQGPGGFIKLGSFRPLEDRAR